MLKNLLGNGSKDREAAEEMRHVLQEIQQERGRNETIVEKVRTSIERMQDIGEPITKVSGEMDSLMERLGSMEKRFEAMVKLSELFQQLDERAEGLSKSQQWAEARVVEVLENSQQMRATLEDLASKTDLAVSLKDQMAQFLEVEKPFHQIKNEVDTLRGTVDATADHMARLREQHDRMVDAHKLSLSKMEALDRRRDDLGRSMSDKERRVAGVEEAVRGLDGVQQNIDDVRRELGTLKALADLVSAKTASLEAQRETTDRALSQSETLDRQMRQLDSRVKQQQENEKALNAMQEQMAILRSQHDTVSERSKAISQLQHEIDEKTQAMRAELSGATDETRKTIERFDFERRGLESVTQRVADLRIAVSDCENRYKGLSEASHTVNDLKSQSDALTSHIVSLGEQTGRLDEDMARLQALRRDLDQSSRFASEVGAQMKKLAEARPAIEGAIHDLQQLNGTHALVNDALEQTNVAHGEMTRFRESQAQTRDWLNSTIHSIGDLKDQVGAMQALAPTVEFVQKQTQRINESMSSIEGRRQFVEDVQRRLTELESMNGQMDEQSRQLNARMQAAEQRFSSLSAQADEAERLTMSITAVSSSVADAQREAQKLSKAIAAIEGQIESVEDLAGKTRSLKQELEQRQGAVAKATKDLEKASQLRQEAATNAQQLEELTQGLTAALNTAEGRSNQVDEISSQLEGRVAALGSVEKRFEQFEKRLAKWGQVDQSVTSALAEMVKRQETVSAIRADLDRMFTMAEQTAAGVREITSTHADIEKSRETIEDVVGRLKEAREIAGSLDERKRQMVKAEERLARAEGLLADIGSTLEALQKQKSIVDQAVEKSGSLQFLLKQAEAAIDGLRDERKMTGDMHAAVQSIRDESDEEEEEDADERKVKRAA